MWQWERSMSTSLNLIGSSGRRLVVRMLSGMAIVCISGCQQQSDVDQRELEERSREIQQKVLTEGDLLFKDFLSSVQGEPLHTQGTNAIDEFCDYLKNTKEVDEKGRIYVGYRLLTLLEDSSGEIRRPPCEPKYLERAYSVLSPKLRRLWLYWAVGSDDIQFVAWAGAGADLLELARQEEDLVVYATFTKSCNVMSALARGGILNDRRGWRPNRCE